MAGTRGDILIRAMTLIRCLEGPTSARELSRHMGCSERTTYRYIQAASLVFPVTQTPTRPARYQIMEGDSHAADDRV